MSYYYLVYFAFTSTSNFNTQSEQLSGRVLVDRLDDLNQNNYLLHGFTLDPKTMGAVVVVIVR